MNTITTVLTLPPPPQSPDLQVGVYGCWHSPVYLWFPWVLVASSGSQDQPLCQLFLWRHESHDLCIESTTSLGKAPKHMIGQQRSHQFCVLSVVFRLWLSFFSLNVNCLFTKTTAVPACLGYLRINYFAPSKLYIKTLGVF